MGHWVLKRLGQAVYVYCNLRGEIQGREAHKAAATGRPDVAMSVRLKPQVFNYCQKIYYAHSVANLANLLLDLLYGPFRTGLPNFTPKKWHGTNLA